TAWRSASSTRLRRFVAGSSTLPLAARITVATSSSARSSADSAGGSRPAIVLSSRSANAFACARSAAVGSASGSGTGAFNRSSLSVGIGASKLLAKRAYGAEQEDVERPDRHVEPARALLARQLLDQAQLDREAIAVLDQVHGVVDARA